MGHLGNWLHDHDWGNANNGKKDWWLFLLIALVAMVAFVLIMLMFPRLTH